MCSKNELGAANLQKHTHTRHTNKTNKRKKIYRNVCTLNNFAHCCHKIEKLNAHRQSDKDISAFFYYVFQNMYTSHHIRFIFFSLSIWLFCWCCVCLRLSLSHRAFHKLANMYNNTFSPHIDVNCTKFTYSISFGCHRCGWSFFLLFLFHSLFVFIQTQESWEKVNYATFIQKRSKKERKKKQSREVRVSAKCFSLWIF